MERRCPCIPSKLVPKPSSSLLFPNLPHHKSSLRWELPPNPLTWRPISLLNQKPTSRSIKSIGFKLESQSTNLKITSEEITLKRVSDETHLEKISKSCTVGERYAQILWQFIESKRPIEARDLYFEMKKEGFDPGIILETAVINIFMKSGWVADAFWVFDNMSERNVVTWTSIISGCILNNCQEVAFGLFSDMMESGLPPNDFTFNVVLQACADQAAVNLGKQVHSLVIRAGFEGDCRIDNCLIDFYSKSFLIEEAHEVFSRMLDPDLVSFTSMIVGFCKNNLFTLAIGLFDRMRWLGLYPNEQTITTILVACDECVLGGQIHAYMIKTLLHQSIYSASALIEFYSKSNSVEKAKLIFDKLDVRNVVTWSTMVSCFLRNGLVDNALKLFSEMAYSDTKPNEYTFATVVSACGLSSESFNLGQQLHCLIIKLNLASDDHIFNSLLTMYARTGKVEELSRVFEKIQNPDIVSWCAAISGYSQNGYGEKSARLLCIMHRKGVKPNEYGLSSALTSCANLSLLDQGRLFHGFALKLGWDFDICVGNALVNMYAKSGSIDDAQLAFDGMHIHDVVSWNTLIHGYAQHGHGVEAFRVFDEMVKLGFLPNHATFVGVLSACNHVGYVEEALRYFMIMDSHYNLAPSMSHYACIIDMMGRAGRFKEAIQIIDKMPFEPDSVIWKSLLGSCAVHKNLELGKIAASRAIELSPMDSANYILISNLHAVCGKWEAAEQMRNIMEEKGVKKDAGWSWIEICSEVHAFTARDRSHPKTEAIYNKLDELTEEMKDKGYTPNLGFAIYDYDFDR